MMLHLPSIVQQNVQLHKWNSNPSNLPSCFQKQIHPILSKSNFITSTMVFSSSSQSIHDIHLPIHWKFQSVLFIISTSDSPNSFIWITFNSTPLQFDFHFPSKIHNGSPNAFFTMLLPNNLIYYNAFSIKSFFQTHSLTLHIVLFQIVSSSTKSRLPS